MKVINSRNVSEALLIALGSLQNEGVERDSRNGPVLVFPEPVSTCYQKPDERVLFFPERDANPFFHFMESLWMISGRNDVEWISQFSSNIENFSDDGITFHGAYGYRWRQHFSFYTQNSSNEVEVHSLDQLDTIANLLKKNQEDRRVVLQMWDAMSDLGMEGKDFPCNLICTFRISPYGKLDMTVFNRSNDIIWGAYGANAVHFSMLQEVMAAWVGVPLGRYWQVSTNFHGYHFTLEKHKGLFDLKPGFDPYTLGEVGTTKIVNKDIGTWFQDLKMFMDEGPVIGLQDPFFKKTVVPMYLAWQQWKNRDDGNHVQRALNHATAIEGSDWRKACVEWLERRK